MTELDAGERHLQGRAASIAPVAVRVAVTALGLEQHPGFGVEAICRPRCRLQLGQVGGHPPGDGFARDRRRLRSHPAQLGQAAVADPLLHLVSAGRLERGGCSAKGLDSIGVGVLAFEEERHTPQRSHRIHDRTLMRPASMRKARPGFRPGEAA